MRCAITGSSGFIGSLLYRRLSEGGSVISTLSRKVGMHDSSRKVFQGDLADADSNLSEFIENVDVIFHCAGELRDESKMYRSHVIGTRNLLSAVVQRISTTGSKVHWVQLSSVGAYGPGQFPDEIRTINECSPLDPRGQYEFTKTVSDELVISASKAETRFTYTILRPSNVVGFGMPNQSFASFAQAVRKGKFFYIGLEERIATYIHVEDLVTSMIEAGSSEKAHSKTLILSNDCPQSELVNAIASHYSARVPSLVLPQSLVRFIVKLIPPIATPLSVKRIDALVKRTRYDTSLAQDLIGFRPRAISNLVASVLGSNDS